MAKSFVRIPPSSIFNKDIQNLNFSIKLFLLKKKIKLYKKKKCKGLEKESKLNNVSIIQP